MADKVKRNQFTLFVGRLCICEGLKLFKLGCELKFISRRYKASCKYFDYDIENEWAQKKYNRVEKILLLPLHFSKLLKNNYKPK